MPRKVEILLTAEDFEQMQTNYHDESFLKAIGYLSTWAMFSERYANVKIYRDRHCDLLAVYSNSGGETTYTIGAVRSEQGEYSFHS